VTTLLLKNIHTLITMNAAGEELRDAAVLIRDNVIEQIGASEVLAATAADRTIDLKGRHIVLPGLINTHHHFYQTLTRVIPAAQNVALFDWLKALYPIWARLTATGVRASAQMCAAELILSGCTTASDHLYIFPNDCTLDEEILAVRELGLRFHASRGSMSVGASLGGLPPDSVVETEADILRDSQRVIETFHDNTRYSMTRITLAPCSPFSVSPALMRESAALARSYARVRLHTHLAENKADVEYSLATFRKTPGEYAESVDWLGGDVWHAHCVWLDDESIRKFAASRTGVAHCPCSNMRLASGMAPIRKMLGAGVAVGLGVDGAASNDSTNLLHETRQAMLLSRVAEQDAAAMTARQALHLATRGGASVLGRDDIGCIAPGMAADLIAVNIDRPTLAGAAHDPVAALVFCQVDAVDYSIINGRVVVDQGVLTTAELPLLRERTNTAAAQMLAN
jgi:8-oxoguanine deaminase